MQLGMIGLGRMGASMAQRLQDHGQSCVVYDPRPEAVQALQALGAQGANSLAGLVEQLVPPRTVWLMVPAAVVDETLDALLPLLLPGDTVIDGGNSHYRDDIRRAARLTGLRMHHVDVGTSGGIAGLLRGYCLMVGGDAQVFERLRPLFAALAPGKGTVATTPGRMACQGSADEGYLRCGEHGAGHFVKMVHNGIEYGLMAAYAEGLNILRHANAGHEAHPADAENAPLREPALYQFEMNLPEITELWRRGSVISSWLLDLTATALQDNPDLQGYEGRVSDSGEGRWTIEAALDEAVPAQVLSAALFERFASRQGSDYANRVLSAMRHAFGGHVEQR